MAATHRRRPAAQRRRRPHGRARRERASCRSAGRGTQRDPRSRSHGRGRRSSRCPSHCRCRGGSAEARPGARRMTSQKFVQLRAARSTRSSSARSSRWQLAQLRQGPAVDRRFHEVVEDLGVGHRVGQAARARPGGRTGTWNWSHARLGRCPAQRQRVEAVVPAPDLVHPVLGHEHGGPADESGRQYRRGPQHISGELCCRGCVGPPRRHRVDEVGELASADSANSSKLARAVGRRRGCRTPRWRPPSRRRRR